MGATKVLRLLLFLGCVALLVGAKSVKWKNGKLRCKSKEKKSNDYVVRKFNGAHFTARSLFTHESVTKTSPGSPLVSAPCFHFLEITISG